MAKESLAYFTRGDYAGEALEWIELAIGEIRKAFIFVAALGL